MMISCIPDYVLWYWGLGMEEEKKKRGRGKKSRPVLVGNAAFSIFFFFPAFSGSDLLVPAVDVRLNGQAGRLYVGGKY